MANDCTFYTTISGDPEKIAKLSNRFGESGRIGLGDYDNFFDEPATDGFEWGSKWMDFYTEYDEGSDMLIVQGDTAWQPISGLWQRISEKYDLFVETSYSEPGCGFAGKDEWNNGEHTLCEESTYMEHLYHNDSEYFWEEIKNNVTYMELDELIDDLGDLYEKLNKIEKERIVEIHIAENQ
jgi:hypothetical protein